MEKICKLDRFILIGFLSVSSMGQAATNNDNTELQHETQYRPTDRDDRDRRDRNPSNIRSSPLYHPRPIYPRAPWYTPNPWPVYPWNWPARFSIMCVAQDSYGNYFDVTEFGYTGWDYQTFMSAVIQASVTRCYYSTGGDIGCRLVFCRPGYVR